MVTCRQCGTHANEETDIVNGVFKCRSCGWRELRGGSAPRRGKPKGGALPAEPAQAAEATAPVTEAPSAPEQSGREPMAWADFDVPALRRLERADFAHWCGGLFERFGYRVRVLCDADDQEAQDADLVAERDGERLLVDCISFLERENVGRPECQRLVGAMLGAECVRAMIVSPGAFEQSAREYVDRLKDVQVDFVDGDRLEETLQAMQTGPLRVWWGMAAA